MDIGRYFSFTIWEKKWGQLSTDPARSKDSIRQRMPLSAPWDTECLAVLLHLDCTFISAASVLTGTSDTFQVERKTSSWLQISSSLTSLTRLPSPALVPACRLQQSLSQTIEWWALVTMGLLAVFLTVIMMIISPAIRAYTQRLMQSFLPLDTESKLLVLLCIVLTLRVIHAQGWSSMQELSQSSTPTTTGMTTASSH